jgi:hypothetical protein
VPLPKRFKEIKVVDPASFLPKGSKLGYFSCKFAYDTKLEKTYCAIHYQNEDGKDQGELLWYNGEFIESIISRFPKLVQANRLGGLSGIGVDYSYTTGHVFIHGYDNNKKRPVLYRMDGDGKTATDLFLDDLSSQNVGPDIRAVGDNPDGTVVIVGTSSFGDLKLVLTKGKDWKGWRDISPNTKYGLWCVDWFPEADYFYATGHGGSFAKISRDGSEVIDRGVNLVLFSATSLKYIDSLKCCIFSQNGAANGDSGSTNLIDGAEKSFDISPPASANFQTLVFYDPMNKFVLDVQCAYPPYTPRVLTKYHVLDVSSSFLVEGNLSFNGGNRWRDVTEEIISLEGYPRDYSPVSVTVPAHCLASAGYIVLTLQLQKDNKKDANKGGESPWLQAGNFVIAIVEFEM